MNARVPRWGELAEAARQATPIAALFAADARRFERFSRRESGLLLDFSKTALTQDTFAHLLALAAASPLAERRRAMFAGEAINETEGRAVGHWALRAGPEARFPVGGADAMPDVRRVRAACFRFAEGVRSGRVAGAGGPFTDVVNLGIGGSDLGPAMATAALRPYHDGPRAHFVSNIDGAHLADTLSGLDPARTLFVVASKTFTTVETMTNAASARRWLVDRLGEAAVAAHFAAVSTALPKVAAFGIAADRTFGFWDWVGGRYSLASAIGLPLMIAIGPDRFQAFLDGAAAMDAHFRDAPDGENLPVLLGLVGLWHRIACGYPSRAVIPYDQRLARFPAYLQQLDMESNGKSVRLDGLPVESPTGPIVWGEPGTNGQHAFFQLLHQGTEIVPVEFLLAAKAHEAGMEAHHRLLVANCLAQSRALMLGRTPAEAGGNPHRAFPGNRPSVTLLYPKLDPARLGQLVALYEHRVFTEAALLGINAFDQWGVELGKEMATALETPLATGKGLDSLDGSTAGLLKAVRGNG